MSAADLEAGSITAEYSITCSHRRVHQTLPALLDWRRGHNSCVSREAAPLPGAMLHGRLLCGLDSAWKGMHGSWQQHQSCCPHAWLAPTPVYPLGAHTSTHMAVQTTADLLQRLAAAPDGNAGAMLTAMCCKRLDCVPTCCMASCRARLDSLFRNRREQMASSLLSACACCCWLSRRALS